jgi:hypothetical protein
LRVLFLEGTAIDAPGIEALEVRGLEKLVVDPAREEKASPPGSFDDDDPL